MTEGYTRSHFGPPQPDRPAASVGDYCSAVLNFNRETGTEDIGIKVGVHCGPSIAVTLNDRLDYFGSTVNMAARLQGESVGGDIVISEDLLADPIVSTMLQPGALSSETRFIKGFSRPITFRRLSGNTKDQ